ncbi:hypothetical protein [Mucilaginibacter phenanthrenivorans]|nr:hypothetical protein [Mucilaginibacter phenanthrenivorans]
MQIRERKYCGDQSGSCKVPSAKTMQIRERKYCGDQSGSCKVPSA